MDIEKTFKLIIAGDGGVGKTSLTNKYVTGLFSEDTRMTIGVEFFRKDLHMDDLGEIRLQIWDFAGEERFRFFIPQYVNGANGIIFVYSSTDPQTMYHLDDWLHLLRSDDPKIPIMLVGSKVDLKHLRKVNSNEAINFAKRRGCSGFVEVSSKTGENVEETFKVITKLMWEHMHQSEFFQM